MHGPTTPTNLDTNHLIERNSSEAKKRHYIVFSFKKKKKISNKFQDI